MFLKSFFFWQDIIKYEYFLNIFIWLLDSILTSSRTPGQSGSGSNGNEKVLYTRAGNSPEFILECYELKGSDFHTCDTNFLEELFSIAEG